jgi:hypothetical protein
MTTYKTVSFQIVVPRGDYCSGPNEKGERVICWWYYNDADMRPHCGLYMSLDLRYDENYNVKKPWICEMLKEI